MFRDPTLSPPTSSKRLFVIGLTCLILLAGCGRALPELDDSDLGGRAGTILLFDGSSGRLVRSVGLSLAREREFQAGEFIRYVTLPVAIEKRITNPDGSFVCRDGTPEPTTEHGTITLRQALELPCRSVFREIQRKIPWSEMIGHLGSFGFGSPTELGGPLEKPGTIPDRLSGEQAWELWSCVDLRVTPLQMGAYFARLHRGDLPLRPETLQTVGDLTRGESAGEYRDHGFAYAWAASYLEGPSGPLTAFFFLLGHEDDTGREIATQLLRTWAGRSGCSLHQGDNGTHAES